MQAIIFSYLGECANVKITMVSPDRDSISYPHYFSDKIKILCHQHICTTRKNGKYIGLNTINDLMQELTFQIKGTVSLDQQFERIAGSMQFTFACKQHPAFSELLTMVRDEFKTNAEAMLSRLSMFKVAQGDTLIASIEHKQENKLPREMKKH